MCLANLIVRVTSDHRHKFASVSVSSDFAEIVFAGHIFPKRTRIVNRFKISIVVIKTLFCTDGF